MARGGGCRCCVCRRGRRASGRRSCWCGCWLVLVRVLARRVSCRARSPTAHDGGPPARRAANALPCTAARGPARLPKLPVVPGCNARHHWVWRQRSSQRSTGWHLELAPGRRPSTHGEGSRTRQPWNDNHHHTATHRNARPQPVSRRTPWPSATVESPAAHPPRAYLQLGPRPRPHQRPPSVSPPAS